MKSLKDIRTNLEGFKDILYKKYPIKSLAIFGSYARNEQTDESDLDLIVEFNERVGSQFIELGEELESHIGFKVDLVSRNGIKEKYFQSIKSDLIYV